MKAIEINGVVTSIYCSSLFELDHDLFLAQFVEWLEGKGLQFGGLTTEIDIEGEINDSNSGV